MSLQFGCGELSVSGISFGRLMNVNVNISYDTAPLRGGNLIFPTYMACYNGTVEGTFEHAELSVTNIARIIGADIAGAATSGTLTLTASHCLITGCDIIVSGVTNGVSGTFTLYNCRFNTVGIKMDRENYTIPSVSFQAVGKSNGDVMKYAL
jgi:hypothetical protein